MECKGRDVRMFAENVISYASHMREECGLSMLDYLAVETMILTSLAVAGNTPLSELLEGIIISYQSTVDRLDKIKRDN